MWEVNLLPSIWNHHTLNPRLSTLTGISRESAWTSKEQSSPIKFLPDFWIWVNTALLFCFIGVLYPQFKKNGDDSVTHSSLRTQHLPPFAAPLWWRQTNAIIWYWLITRWDLQAPVNIIMNLLDQLNDHNFIWNHHYLLKEDFAPLS
jgi:hypothetical protein